MLFCMVDQRTGYSMGATGSTIRASRADDPVFATNMPESRARTYIGEFAEALEDGWRDGMTKVDRFEAFRALDDETKAQWMAWVVATSLTAKDEPGTPEPNRLQNRLATILEIDVASWWRPNSINFFDRISKGSMMALLDQVGGPALSGRHATQKKAEISVSCEKLFAGEAIVEAEVREAAVAWVPEAMRFTEPAPAPEETDADDRDDDLTLPSDEEQDVDLQLTGDHEDDDDLQLIDADGEDPEEGPGLPIDDEDDFTSDRDVEDDFGVNDHAEAIAAE